MTITIKYLKFFITFFLGSLLMNNLYSENNPHDLVEIKKLCPSIVLDIRYATANNFTGKVVYSSPRCFMRRTTAEKLIKVQEELAKFGLGLKIFDAYRPRRVQYKFWELVPDERYVANPAKGSKHNRGTAVDCTLVMSDGAELAMPTEFDDFTEKAHRDYKKLPAKVIRNRELLENIMTKHGFIGLPTEWWHFDDTDWEKYDLLDIAFEDIP